MALVMLTFAMASFLLFVGILLSVFDRKRGIEKRVSSYLAPEDKKQVERPKSLFAKLLAEINQRLKKGLTHGKSNLKAELFLQSTGVLWTPAEYAVYRVMAAFICGCLLYLLTSNIILGILGLVLGFIYPKLWLTSKRKKRLRMFNDGLADMITSIINSLKAGFSFIQALKAVEEEMDSPIKEEIALVLKEMQYGSNLEDALSHLYGRVPSQDLDIMIQAILIQRQVGGNLATVLTNIVETIRERNKIHRQVKTLTAQGKLSGMVIGFMPFVLGFIIFLIQPSYVSVMFTNPIGIMMLSFGIISGIIGFLLIQKLTKIEV